MACAAVATSAYGLAIARFRTATLNVKLATQPTASGRIGAPILDIVRSLRIVASLLETTTVGEAKHVKRRDVVRSNLMGASPQEMRIVKKRRAVRTRGSAQHTGVNAVQGKLRTVRLRGFASN